MVPPETPRLNPVLSRGLVRAVMQKAGIETRHETVFVKRCLWAGTPMVRVRSDEKSIL